MPMTRMVSLRRAKKSSAPRATSGTPATISARADQRHFIMRYGTAADSVVPSMATVLATRRPQRRWSAC